MSTPIAEAQTEEFVLVSGPAWAIQCPNGTLYRDQHAWLMDPDGTQASVWFERAGAEAQLHILGVTLELWYGLPDAVLAAFHVVPVEMGPDGQWRVIVPDPAEYEDGDDGPHPLNLDTEELSRWGCRSAVDLTEDDARQVMRDHRDCAGLFPCKVRGRARGLLARQGLMVLDTRPNAWDGLDMPETAR